MTGVIRIWIFAKPHVYLDVEIGENVTNRIKRYKYVDFLQVADFTKELQFGLLSVMAPKFIEMG